MGSPPLSASPPLTVRNESAAFSSSRAARHMKSASVWHPPNLLPRLLPRDGDLSTFYRPIAAGCRNEKSAPIARFLLGFCLVAPTGFEPVFESRSRFRQVSYAVTEQQHPATSTRLKHAAESSLKHPEHDHVKREPGGPSPDERKLQNNFRTGWSTQSAPGTPSPRVSEGRPSPAKRGA